MSLTRLRLPTLAARFSSRHNAIGLLRLTLASSVLIAHSWPLGLGQPNLGTVETSRQTDLGTMAVYGFFVLSGFLITGSGLKFPLGRFAWHRFLRIFPGLWVCLLVTALVIAPLAAIFEHGNLDGFWGHPLGPFDYLATNWFASMQQYPISGLLSDTPYGRMIGGHPSAFAGSLWSLRYELACYVLVGVLLVTAVLRRAPRAVIVLVGICYAVLLTDFLQGTNWTSRPPSHGGLGPYPLIGYFDVHQLVYLGFLFLLGAAARLYQHRLPMHGAIAGVAGLVLVLSMRFGGFFVLGLPAYAYLLLYAAVALPAWLQEVGRVQDYSYGIYIYAFPVQQTVALLGGAEYGLVAFIALSAVGTLALAVASWHLVERPAMGLKDHPAPFGELRERLGKRLGITPRAPEALPRQLGVSHQRQSETVGSPNEDTAQLPIVQPALHAAGPGTAEDAPKTTKAASGRG